MLAAPEFVIAERIELLDQIEVAAELQHRMLADRVMRGEEGSEFQARHGFLSGLSIVGLLWALVAKLRAGSRQGNRGRAIAAYPAWCHARRRWIAGAVRL